MKWLVNKKLINSISLLIGLLGVLLGIAGVCLTIQANHKSEEVENRELEVNQVILSATLQQVISYGPSGGKPEFALWSVEKQRERS